MSELTALTREQVRAVLLGLAEHGSGTEADHFRRQAVDAMGAALTQPRPVDPELALLRSLLAETLGWDGSDCTDDELVAEVRETIARLTTGGDRFRDLLAALLDLDPSADDDTIAEAATARAAQRALGRSAEKTAALVTPASAQSGHLLNRLLDVLRWTHGAEDLATVADRVVSEVWRLRGIEAKQAGELATAIGADPTLAVWSDMLGTVRDLVRASDPKWAVGLQADHEEGLQRAGKHYAAVRTLTAWDDLDATQRETWWGEAKDIVDAYLNRADPT